MPRVSRDGRQIDVVWKRRYRAQEKRGGSRPSQYLNVCVVNKSEGFYHVYGVFRRFVVWQLTMLSNVAFFTMILVVVKIGVLSPLNSSSSTVAIACDAPARDGRTRALPHGVQGRRCSTMRKHRKR